MDIELKTVSTKILLTTIFTSFTFIIGLSIILLIYTNNTSLFLLFIPVLGLSIYFAIKVSKKTTRIDLRNDDYIKINGQTISYKDIIGYFIDDRGGLQKAFCLKLTNDKTLMITGATTGKEAEVLDNTIHKIIDVTQQNNQSFRELEYKDIYKEYGILSKPAFRIVLAVILFVLILLKILLL
ncbi:hypothetical protein [Tenacibaculum xiamenense]|uniref:hypothetical protein n=1 Tax=Tenacibaculum xiamenense TaxID=1261553 RepID=UPI0038947687